MTGNDRASDGRGRAARWLSGALCGLLLLLSSPVLAQTCTNQAFFAPSATNGSKLLGDVMKVITEVMQNTADGVYTYIVKDTGYLNAIAALVTLYIAIYGAMIMFDMVDNKPSEVVMRLVRIGMLYAFIGPGGLEFFNGFARGFFVGGMNEIITLFNNIALGQRLPPGPDSVTSILAVPAGTVLSTRVFIIILAVFFTGPFGFIFALCMIWALGVFLYAILAALGTYLQALVGLFFLFALAPIFFSFMLFERTRGLFQGWLNQMVNFMLQPVFVFSFLGFFFVMIGAAMDAIMRVPACKVFFTLFKIGPVPIGIDFWRFMVPVDPANPNPDPATGYKIYKGGWSTCGPEQFCDGAACATCQYPVFPVDIMSLVFLVLVAHLAWKYVAFVGDIAKSIAGAQASVTLSGAQVQKWFTDRNLTVGQIGKNAAIGAGAGMIGGARRGVSKIIDLATGGNKPPEGKTRNANAEAASGANERGAPGGKDAPPKNTAAPDTGKAGDQTDLFKQPPGRGGGGRGN